jgi:hypothetical protein
MAVVTTPVPRKAIHVQPNLGYAPDISIAHLSAAGKPH